MALAGEIEVYTWSMGVMSQLVREMAAGNPGLITRTGLHTFIDPRHEGGRQGPKRGPDMVEVMNWAGEEFLYFHATAHRRRLHPGHHRRHQGQPHHGA